MSVNYLDAESNPTALTTRTTTTVNYANTPQGLLTYAPVTSSNTNLGDHMALTLDIDSASKTAIEAAFS